MRKFRRIYVVVSLLTVIIIMAAKLNMAANHIARFGWSENNAVKDTVPATNSTTVKKDTIPTADSAVSRNDSALQPASDTFALRISKDTLEAPINYEAKDSVVGFIDSKRIFLYGGSKTDYKDMTLTAPVIELDQSTSTVTAKASRDSLDDVKDYATMKQPDNEVKGESMVFNFKTKQGITRQSITQQGEMFVHADVVKKVNENTMFGQDFFFTTCNLDQPHFGFRAKRAKIVNKKLAVTGPVRPEFDSVPVPIYLPFGFYPLSQGRHSGLLPASLETNDQMGLGLNGLGYYKVINDYWDVKVYGTIYSYGTWMANVTPTYRKLYRYQGSFNFGLQSTRRNFKGDPDYSKSNTYTINWGHSSDTRSRPGVTFSANVNASSTKYNRNVPNNNQINFQNVLGSSITYSKAWQDKPFNLSVSANHNQNNASHLMTINFPAASFSVSTLYPFQKKERVGSKKWYDQLGIGYTTSVTNGVSFYDTLDYARQRGKSFSQFLLDTLQWGATHSIPITLSLPPILGGAVTVSPSVSYSQNWVGKETSLSWVEQGGVRYDSLNNRNYDTITVNTGNKFGIRQQASFGIAFNTALYGTYQFHNKKVMAIRHVVRPTVSFNYTPDLSKNDWRRLIKTQDGKMIGSILYNRYQPYTSSSYDYLNRPEAQFISNRSAGISFGIDNNLEMKKRTTPKKNADSDSLDNNTSSTDAKDNTKKIRLIDGFGINSSYNFLADSLRLAPFNIYFRTNLFEKINLNASANLIPYVLNAYGAATSRYAWQDGQFSVGKITSANISLSTSFQSKPKDPKKAKQREDAINKNLNDPMLQADQQRLMEYMRQNPAEFVDFNTPWSVSLSYSFSYTRGARRITSINTTNVPVPANQVAALGKWENRITSGASFTGSFNLTPKWNFSVNGFYDVPTSKIQTFSMAISRDLHCWQMAINVTPVGIYRYFNFTISPKAGILQDLKINRTRSFTR